MVLTTLLVLVASAESVHSEDSLDGTTNDHILTAGAGVAGANDAAAESPSALAQLLPFLQHGLTWIDTIVLETLSISNGSTYFMVVMVLSLSVVALVLCCGMPGGGGRADAPGGGKRSRKILLIGPSGVGKTVIANKLCKGWLPETVTSMKSVNYEYQLPGGGMTVCLTDFPGHERLRPGVKQALSQSIGVVFVLNALDLGGQARTAADLLYTVLTDPTAERLKGVLVVANKAEGKVIKTVRIKTILQRELEKLRVTRDAYGTASLGEIGDADSSASSGKSLPLGRQGQPIDLEVDSPCEMTFASCSANEGQLDCITAFIAQCVR